MNHGRRSSPVRSPLFDASSPDAGEKEGQPPRRAARISQSTTHVEFVGSALHRFFEPHPGLLLCYALRGHQDGSMISTS